MVQMESSSLITLSTVLLLFATFVTPQTPPGGYYHTKYDHLDVEDVLNHKRLVYHYAKCLLSKGPCPPEGADLKRILPEALETTCLRCTEKQKTVVLHTIKRLRKEYADLWKEVSDLWDPTGEYIKKFEATFDKATPTPSTTTPSPNAIDPSPNLLSNRFNDDDSSNDLVPNNSRPYPASSSSTTTTTTTLSPLPSSVPSFSTLFPSSTSTGTKTRPPTYLEGIKPIRWWVTTTTATKGVHPVSHWRPTTQNIFFRPQTRPVLPILTVDGVKILGSISDLGTKVLQAGTQVAGMVLSTVQALVRP